MNKTLKFLKKLTTAHRTLAAVQYLCVHTDCDRGIWKRLDENRELLECIQNNAPDFVERCPWIINWFGCQDAFLLSLKNLLHLESSPFPKFCHPFPRPWLGRFDSLGLSEEWTETCLKNSNHCF